ncbi:hypothetical protein LOC67_10280 [Stieleria sp. JC731]|uniref:hypothetical protein n=1 Tax=Pirellulaceae TaxID=2691357 RepID=UPI001E3C7EE9|nr:hypothetical protein [Stieleria sp. JC731]MCC9600954.1 hypothetical protein [Stieleria sp. JC731]
MNYNIDPIHPDDPKSESGSSNRVTGLLTSMVVHGAFLVILALMVVSDQNPFANVIRLYASHGDSDSLADLVSLDLSANSQSQTPRAESEFITVDLQSQFDVQADDLNSLLAPDVLIEPSDLQAMVSMPDRLKMTTGTKSKNSEKSLFEQMSSALQKQSSYTGPLLKDAKDGVRQTRTTAGAAQGILDQLRETNEHEGPVWILWVMDASISLVNERQQLAPIIGNFYDEIKVARKPGPFPWPTTAVFAFGQGVVPLGVNKGMPKPLDIANTLINVPIDQSGVENVMSAVSAAIASVPTRNPDTRIEVVVWSDESGDDLNALEDVILLCQQRKARVHVVGPLSVFGIKKGLQQFTLPFPYNQPILLPVDRGPDSAFPERAQLPYWYESTDIDWGNGPIIPANLGNDDFGGPHRQRLLAPSGPYALTRLALATGGTFTAINRPGDIATATRDELFDYMPDYRSTAEIAYDINRYPLRRAVIEAAALTGTAEYWPPRMSYPSSISDQFPYRNVSWYMGPVRFSNRLPDDLEVSVKRLRHAQQVIEQAIQIMMLRFDHSDSLASESSDSETEFVLHEVSLEQVTPSEYYQEQSPRWKAWYDLNLGRLLAHSVRIHEFILQCEILASRESRAMMLSQGFNQLKMVPSQEMKGGIVSATRVQTAVKLLERVTRDHADTPWGDLATWELEHPVGVRPVLSTLPPPIRVARPMSRPQTSRPTIPRL